MNVMKFYIKFQTQISLSSLMKFNFITLSNFITFITFINERAVH